jgi:hypothetical protein
MGTIDEKQRQRHLELWTRTLFEQAIAAVRRNDAAEFVRLYRLGGPPLWKRLESAGADLEAFVAKFRRDDAH